MMVEGVKEQTKKHTIIILLSLLLTLSIYIVPQVIAPAITQNTTTPEETITSLSSSQYYHDQDKPFLLIILSPQYQNDSLIVNEIINYQQAIYEQPKWSSQIQTLTEETNTIAHIDALIDQYTKKYNLSAILLIGEDIKLATKTEYNNIIKPDIKTYSTLNNKPNNTHVCISLLHPHPTDSYQQKQSDIINTLNRFSQKRTFNINSNSLIIEQKDLSIYSDKDYKELENIYHASYQKEVTATDVNTLFLDQFDLISLHGHGQPHQIMLNTTSNIKITSKFLSKINTEMVTIDGCYTDSMYKDQDDSQQVFLSSVCKSNTLHIGFFGLLSQKTSTEQHNVINTILSNVNHDHTIAETINNAQIGFDFVFSGDPTIQIIIQN